MKKIIVSLCLLSFVALAIIGCEDFNKLTAPEVSLGSADFTRFVAIGNSITAGYQSGTIYESGQMYSYGNLIAKQVGVDYQIPYVSDPGLGGRLEIESLPPNFKIYTNPNVGSFLNANYPAPYNNLGVPGALLYDVLNATNSTTCASYVLSSTPTPNPYFDLILRNSALNIGTQLQQALAQSPTFITLWIGNNDVLGYATSGGFAPTEPFPASNFNALYNLLGQALGQYATQSGAKVVVANIPNVSTIPFFTTVGPQMAAGIPWGYLASVGAPGLFIQKHGETVNPTSFTDSISLANLSVLITLTGSTYASPSILGKPGGKFYRDFGFPGLPAGIDTTKPFGFHPQNPWPDALILDAEEIMTANTTVSDYNTTIADASTNFGFGLVDINTLFNQLRAADFTDGTSINGITFKTTYVSGGLFSLDGVHPSNQAHGIVANEFIKVINTKYGANIPLVDVSTIPGSIYFFSKISYKQGYPIIPNEVFEHLLF
jgi:lysophospholipase L1-like esterase